MVSIPNPVDIKYSGFYLPIFSLLFIQHEVKLPVELPIPLVNIGLYEGNFGYILGLTFLGALVGHGASRSIYGIEGAKTNPKNRWAVLWYRTLFSFKKRPGKPPKTIDDLIEKMAASVERFLAISRLNKAITVIYSLARLALIFPAKLTFLAVAFLTTWILAVAALNGPLQPVGTLLLITQVVFFFGSWIFNQYPTPVPVDAAPWVYLAEYHKADYLHQRGAIDFEYGPLNFTDSVVEEFEETRRTVRNRPVYYDKEDVDWLIPIEETEPDYLIKLKRSTEKDE